MFWPGQYKARSLILAVGMWCRALHRVKKLQPDIVEFYGGEAWLATDRLSRIKDRTFKIVAHSNGIEPFVAQTLARHAIHNTAQGESPKWYQGRLRLPVEKAFTRADAIVTVSQPEADYAIQHGFKSREFVLSIDNALPEDFIGLAFDAKRPKVIGFCGSWLARKGVDLIVSDVSAVLRQFSEWKLNIVGVGRDFQARQHFPADVVRQITVNSFVTDKAELRGIYNSWAIALMPSVYESFGLVAAETMACGCALVASRTGFAASLTDGEEAMLLIEQASPCLKDALTALIQDEALRMRVARRGQERVQRLRWLPNTAALENFYISLVGHGFQDAPGRSLSVGV